MGHISDHSRGRRDMSLALSVWRCGPIGLRPRACGARKAMLGHRYIYKLKVLESWHVCPRRFRGRVFMAGAFLGRGASNSTRNASPRPALPPGPRLDALLLSNVRAHADGQMAGLRNKGQERSLNKQHLLGRTMLDQTRRSGPRQGGRGRGPRPENNLCCNSP